MTKKVLTRELQAETIDQPRRRFFGSAAATIAAAQLGMIASAAAQSGDAASKVSAIKPGTGASFKALKQINAGLLNVGYAEDGPADGSAVVLLHGWPYDIHSYVDVAPLLAVKGYRVIVPYLRGYGTTSFLSSASMRNAQQSAVALDMIALMDALKIQKAIFAGFDWGARTAAIMAVLWPERCKAIVSVGGYLIGSPAANQVPYPPAPTLAFWYQYYFATEIGQAATGNTCATLQSSSGRPLHRNGTSMTPRSNARLRRSTIRITSPSRSITIAGESAWLTANENMTIWKSNWPRFVPSPYPPSPWKATPMAQFTHPARRIAISSRASMSTA